MNTPYKRGTKLLIELSGGEMYEGSYYSGDNDRITITDVAEYPSGVKNNYPYNFYKMEITSIKIIDDKKDPDDETSESEAASEDTSESTSAITMLEEDYEHLKESANKYKYISRVDARFFEIMTHLKTCTEIALFGMGNNLGRNSKILLLTVSTNSQIYIFDLSVSGVKVFEMGLKEILESKRILKIVHNSKLLSDCLYHVYRTSLNNVFDTQVADILILKNENGQLPLKTRTFAECVEFHLNIPSTVIENSELSAKELKERPLCDEHKVKAALHVAYLYVLRKVLQNKLLHDFNLAVECYANCMKNADPTVAHHLLDEAVPKAIKDLNL